MSFLELFLIIGLAHWASHILECDSCRAWMFGGITFSLEGVVATLGWPFKLLSFLLRYFDKDRRELPRAVNNIVIAQQEGESNEDFRSKTIETINETITARQTELKND